MVSEPGFTGMEWYAEYGARHATDGAEGRLVSVYTFTEPWSSWEMHPQGGEVVICTAGEMTLLQEIDGQGRGARRSASPSRPTATSSSAARRAAAPRATSASRG